jgi:hypothetical protein
MKSVSAQLSVSKGAWFREDESLLTDDEHSLHGLVIGPKRRDDLTSRVLVKRGSEEVRSMKAALCAAALAALLAAAPFAAGTLAATDDSAQQHVRFSPEDRAAFVDARIAALKAGLELNAEQEKNWPALESAMRDLAKERAARFAAWREKREAGGDEAGINPIDRLTRASEFLSARAADLEKLASAAKPLYDSLDDGQKRRFAMLFQRPMRRGHWRHDD